MNDAESETTDVQKYTVGWICALHKEYLAARQDIRLGDVLVGQAVGATPAVLKYGMGRKYQDASGQKTWEETFEMTAQLNNTPNVLLTALNTLRVIHDEEGNDIANKVDTAVSRIPKKSTRKEYQRPPHDSDVLFASDFVHPREAGDTCNDHDESAVINRPLRDEEDDKVKSTTDRSDQRTSS
ncbi:Hypothetical protein D9617_7g031020 [Elsinoe fawcettii]|nr:Hypothetical protein D9617_7g031020 [Elsinoe fawcettii]